MEILYFFLIFLCSIKSTPECQEPIKRVKCEDLFKLKVEDTNFLSSTIIRAEPSLDVEFCRVLGYIRPAINFEIRLPVNTWNIKFYMSGCGGFCGRLDSDMPKFANAVSFALLRGYATVNMDTGHWGQNRMDSRFAFRNPIAQNDFAHRGVHESQRVAKIVIEKFFGEPPVKSYFGGCSTGGRQGLMEAMKYPNDFDGIISGAPAMDYPGLVASYGAAIYQANLDANGERILTAERVPILQAAVFGECANSKGIIEDPLECSFDPHSIQCSQPPENESQSEVLEKSDCLTEAEIGVVSKWYDGSKTSSGQDVYVGGLPFGSEPFWPFWLLGNPPVFLEICVQFVQNWGFDMTSLAEFSLDTDVETPLMHNLAAQLNTDDVARLQPFKERGGKLLLWQGLADCVVTPWKTIQFYENAVAFYGAGVVDQFFHFVKIPGMGHCGLLPAPDGRDQTGLEVLLDELDAWVEKGKVPDLALIVNG